MKVFGNFANPGTDVRWVSLGEDTLRVVCTASGGGLRGTSGVGSGGETFARTVEGAVRAERVSARGRPVMAARTVMLAVAAVTIVTAAVSVVLPA